MTIRAVRPTAAVVIAMCVCAIARADGQTTRRESDFLKQKIATIVQVGAGPAAKQPRRTTVTESELNAYLVYEAKTDIPTGVVDPTVTILGSGRVSGRAVVDLDAVRKQQNPTSMFDPTSYLTGRLPITAVGTLTTSNGIGRFQLESAMVGGVPVPKVVLQQIVSYYSKTPAQPAGINLDDPFALPARIREIQVQRGQAIIVQ